MLNNLIKNPNWLKHQIFCFANNLNHKIQVQSITNKKKNLKIHWNIHRWCIYDPSIQLALLYKVTSHIIVLLLSIILKGVSFLLCKAQLFIISPITVDELYKISCFFNLILNFFQRFSSNWRSIDFNFLWESGIEKIRIEMKKCIKYGWHIIIFTKDALCSLNFKNQVNYTISVHQYFSNSILVKKFIFVIFQFLVKRGERRVAIFWW